MRGNKMLSPSLSEWDLRDGFVLFVVVRLCAAVLRVIRRGSRHRPALKNYELLVTVPLELACSVGGMWEVWGAHNDIIAKGVFGLFAFGTTLTLSQGKRWTGWEPKVALTIALHHAVPEWRLVAYVSILLAVLFGEGDTSKQFETVSAPEVAFMGLSRPNLGNFDRPPRFTILTAGSRGDVQPFIALAQALREQGAQVKIGGMAAYRSLAERYNIGYFDNGIEDVEQVGQVWRDATSVSQVIASSHDNIHRLFSVVGERYYNASQDADCIIATSTTSGMALSIAEKLCVPCWVVKLAPDIPTRAFPPPRATPSSIGIFNLFRWYRHWYSVVRAMPSKNPEQVFRTEVLKLPPLKKGSRVKVMLSTPTLCAFSRALVPKPADWPVCAKVTGFWFVRDSKSAYKLDTKLESFLMASPKAICVNFGSMTAAADKLGVLNSTLDTLARASRPGHPVRIVLVTKVFDGSQKLALEESVMANGGRLLIVDDVPHESLFPKCQLVVHHGGAGTSGSALRHGVPSIIVPIMLWTDQCMWAERISSLGGAICVTRDAPDFKAKLGEAYEKVLQGDLDVQAKALSKSLNDEGTSGASLAAKAILSTVCTHER